MSETFHRKPWVGSRYAGSPGRLLVVGDSHYGTPAEARDPEFTVKLIDGYLRGERRLGYCTKVACLVTGKSGYEVDREVFWHSVAFANYLSAFLEGPARAPTGDEWAASVEPFRRLLSDLAPLHIVFLASRLWKAVRANHTEFEDDVKMGFEWGEWDVADVRLGNERARATWIKHPARARREEWHEIVAAFMRDVV